MLKRLGIMLLVAVVSGLCLQFSERFSVPFMHGFVSSAQAVIGRPLTPMSYAGVGTQDGAAVRGRRLLLLGRSP
jgi:hypothetical protein